LLHGKTKFLLKTGFNQQQHRLQQFPVKLEFDASSVLEMITVKGYQEELLTLDALERHFLEEVGLKRSTERSPQQMGTLLCSRHSPRQSTLDDSCIVPQQKRTYARLKKGRVSPKARQLQELLVAYLAGDEARKISANSRRLMLVRVPRCLKKHPCMLSSCRYVLDSDCFPLFNGRSKNEQTIGDQAHASLVVSSHLAPETLIQ
jgi:hypothetical protein